MRLQYFIPVLLMLVVPGIPAYAKSDQEIRKTLIQQSIAAYPGNCPCPYNSASNGSRCGKRSAYNRAGGYSPLCYEDDITDAMVEAYKHQNLRK